MTLDDIKEKKIYKPGIGQVKFSGCCQAAANDGLDYI
jgi:hypothetical protein